MLSESESNPAADELERLEVLEVAKRNGNTLFIDNIEREIQLLNVVINLH